MTKADEREVFELIDQLAQNGSDLEARVAALEQRGFWNWLRRILPGRKA